MKMEVSVRGMIQSSGKYQLTIDLLMGACIGFSVEKIYTRAFQNQ